MFNKKIAGSEECLPPWLLSIEGRTCNLTPLVHQDMTKKTTFYNQKQGEIIQVKCKLGVWFQCLYFLSLTSMYVPSLISIP